MGIGPVEYMVVGFPGNRFTGDIAPALAELVDAGTIRIIDLAIVTKDADGDVAALEVSDADSDFGRALSKLAGNMTPGIVNEDDLMAVGEELEPNSTAALLVWEDVWATKVRDAIVASGGELWDLERVPAPVVQAAVDWASENA
jgi:uncharacterized membrane protein